MKKSNSLRGELKVLRKEFVTPHYIRVFFESDQINELSKATVGIHNKIMIPPAGSEKIVFPEYDNEKKKWKEQTQDTKCIVRTYTHRGIDLEKKELWIDFVAHGDEGPASAWALSAEKGSLLGVSMSGDEVELFPKVSNYVLIGDATAIPVLSVILEQLSVGTKGVCIIEVHGPEDEQNLSTRSDVRIIWLHNNNPQRGSKLTEITKQLILPDDSRFAYVAAEFKVVKEIRQYLRKELRWDREEVDAYSYWKIGSSEDKSASERHHENADNS